MNWMGGSLARHSKLPSTTKKERQKIPVPVSSSLQLRRRLYLPCFAPNLIGLNHDIKYESPNTVNEHKRQKTLEEYPDVAPLVDHLEAMLNSRPSAEFPRNLQIAAKRQKLNISSLTSCFKGTKPTLPSVANTKEENADKEQTKCFENHDINAIQSSPTIIERKKLQMLDQPDWAGLRYTRLVHINFTKRKREVIERPKIAMQNQLPVRKAVDIRRHGR